MRNRTIFFDTSIIIESCRCKIWKNLVDAYDIHTVNKVVEECNPKSHRQTYDFIDIDIKYLKSKVNIHSVTEEQKVKLALTDGMVELDPGENELLAFLPDYQEPFKLCLSDKAAIHTVIILKFEDHLISLEKLACDINQKKKFNYQYTREFMSKTKTMFLI